MLVFGHALSQSSSDSYGIMLTPSRRGVNATVTALGQDALTMSALSVYVAHMRNCVAWRLLTR